MITLRSGLYAAGLTALAAGLSVGLRSALANPPGEAGSAGGERKATAVYDERFDAAEVLYPSLESGWTALAPSAKMPAVAAFRKRADGSWTLEGSDAAPVVTAWTSTKHIHFQ